MARYDYSRYDRGYGRNMPYSGWYPGAFWGGAPMFGWGAWGGAEGWPPYAPVGYGRYDRNYTPRRPPRESGAYGLGGDRELREWARRAGYDVGYEIQPRGFRGGRPRRGYDRW